MTIINFEQIKYKATRKEIINGKKVVRSKTFTQTVNPFNKNEDGTIKTRNEVYQSVKQEALEWSKEELLTKG